MRQKYHDWIRVSLISGHGNSFQDDKRSRLRPFGKLWATASQVAQGAWRKA